MNYRHAFHVGNHGDVLKHLALVLCLDALKRKPAPFAVLDTHAGRGMYDLKSDEAARSPEWQDGIGKLWNWPQPPAPVARYLDAIRAFNADALLRTYPGSPALVTAALREQDALIACELHPQEHAALKRALPRVGRVQIHQRDGWEALSALLPPKQKRGLVLIDPPYEAADELTHAARALGPALKRFGHGAFIWWRPLKSDSALNKVDAEVRAQGARETLRADLWTDTPQPEGRLNGSSLLFINPPFGIEDALREALPFLADALTKGRSGWRLEVK